MAAQPSAEAVQPTRERLFYSLCEAAELEHTLMCTYLYAAFSLKSAKPKASAPPRPMPSRAGGARSSASRSTRWAISPRCGTSRPRSAARRASGAAISRSTGRMPAGIVVKLAPFNRGHAAALHLSRAPARFGRARRRRLRAASGIYSRGVDAAAADADGRSTTKPSARSTTTLGRNLRCFVEHDRREGRVLRRSRRCSFRRPRSISRASSRVICSKTALAAFDAIVEQGEGAPRHATDSHFARFCAIRARVARAQGEANPAFEPAFPAAHNPVLRPPPRPEGRVWIENAQAVGRPSISRTRRTR